MTQIAQPGGAAHPTPNNSFSDAVTVGSNLLAIPGTHGGVVLCQVSAATLVVLDNGTTTETLNDTSPAGFSLNVAIPAGTAVYVRRLYGSPSRAETFLSWRE